MEQYTPTTFSDANEVRRVPKPPGHVFLIKLVHAEHPVQTSYAEDLEESEKAFSLIGAVALRASAGGKLVPKPLRTPLKVRESHNYAFYAYPVPKPAWWNAKPEAASDVVK